MSSLKIFIISDEIPLNHPEFKKKWICDILKDEFSQANKYNVTNNPNDADVIWYLAPWNYRKIPFQDISDWRELLKEKYVICTIHHIDEDKYLEGEHDKIFHFIKRYANLYHVLCKSTETFLKKLDHGIEIRLIPLWVNDNVFYFMNKKKELREKYKFSKDAYLVGSFQKDTEGRKYWRCPYCFSCNRDEKILNVKCKCGKPAPEWTNCKNKLEKFEYYPKFSKGPDLFVKIIKDMKDNGKNVEVILGGIRRQYITTQLDKMGIKYYYFEMVELEIINELYNCLDLYLVSSRYEGGPRSIFEASITKTPIISTDVGIANFILDKKSIYDFNNYLTYKNAKYNIEYAYNNINKLKLENYMGNFYSELIKSVEEKSEVYKLENIGINCINIDIECKSKTYLQFDDKKLLLRNGKSTLCYNFKRNFFLIKSDNDDHKINSINFNKGVTSKNKWDNNKINILLCSDENYFVGLFACLNSVVSNTNNLSEIYFNFIIPIESVNIFFNLLEKFNKKLTVELDFTLIILSDNILDESIKKSKCFNGGNHLLNIGNFSRLLVSEYFNYKKLIYLDSDSILQKDIIDRVLKFNLDNPIYSRKMDKKNLTLKMSTIINTDVSFKEIIGLDIDSNDYAYMGAPFLANLKLWDNIYLKIVNLIKLHNNHKDGVYKLFTMSIQNILFYKKLGNINKILNCLPDCGSTRKNWNRDILDNSDVLDWSGIFKPWYKNGLHKDYWSIYDILNLSNNFGEINSNKNTVETFKINKNIINNKINKKKKYEIDILDIDKKPTIKKRNYRRGSKNLIIGTTAINRVDLHNDNIKEWSDYLTMIRGLNITWILNVDVVDKLEFNWEETVKNFGNQLSSSIEFIPLPKKKPGFVEACHVVSKNIYKYIIDNNLEINNTYIMWLEDDWKLHKKATSNVSLNYFFNIMNGYSYVNLSFIRNNYIWALAPSIIGFNLFKDLHYTCWKECNDNNIKGDAEHILGKYFIKKFSINPDDILTINVIDNRIKKIKEEYMTQKFINYKNARTMIYNIKYNTKFKMHNEILLKDVENFIGNQVNFFRITPGWCLDGVNYGRKYMESKNVKKWAKGDGSCQYKDI